MNAAYVSKKTILLCVISIHSLSARVTWQDTNVFNVTDENIVIDHNAILPAGIITVHAVEKNIQIELKGETHIYGSQEGESEIILAAEANREIKIKGNHTLKFVPSENHNIKLSQEGCGTSKIVICK